jgi:integrase
VTPLWEFAAGTGVSRGELLALRWSELDLDHGVLRVERSVTQVGPNRTYGTPKTHERGEVAVDEHVVSTLRSWRKQQVAERLALGQGFEDDEDLLFTWPDGRVVPRTMSPRSSVA